MSKPKILLVVGSPRGRKSVSGVLASFLQERLAKRNTETETLYVSNVRWTPLEVGHFHSALDGADLAVFAFPLYADQLPGNLVAALEGYAKYRRSGREVNLKSIAAVVNSGFPEAHQNDQALAVVRRFAELHGCAFLGGLALGGGGMVQIDRPLERQGGRVFKVVRALDLAAAALAQERPLTEETLKIIRKPTIPNFLYAWIAEFGFRWDGWKAKVNLKARPYSDQ